jgi:SagB-type dehydrogenase family enzyme
VARCPSCSAESAEGRRFCGECGARRLTAQLITWLALLGCLAGCAATPGAGNDAEETDMRSRDETRLPAPRRDSEVSLEEALAKRRSVREFAGEPLSEQDLSQLLWAAQGITADWGGRTAPSAGALYPLELYVVTAEGVFHHDPETRRQQRVADEDRRPALHRAALEQNEILEAPAVVVIAAVYARTSKKYGRERSPRYVHMEAGHAAQNLLLQATALGLVAVPMGAFEDAAVRHALELPADHEPLYLIPVGWPR